MRNCDGRNEEFEEKGKGMFGAGSKVEAGSLCRLSRAQTRP